MTSVVESTLAGMPWIRIDGSRKDVFTALGERFAEQIGDLRTSMGQWVRLRARFAADPAVVEAVRESTRRLCPVESAEVEWLAAGAGLPAEDLWLLNLRGDVGTDSTGCSDVCIPGRRPFLAHNEDGDPAVGASMAVVTLHIPGDPAVSVIWYPGMLPANSMVATSAGLLWGMDHVTVPAPDRGAAGRHFVARHAQRQGSADRAIGALRAVPSAGGFSYTIGDGATGRMAFVESAAGRVAIHRVEESPSWHTNHLRFLDPRAPGLRLPAEDPDVDESVGRGGLIDRSLREHVPRTIDEVASILRQPDVGKLVPVQGHAMTLATTVVDLSARRIWIRHAGAGEALGLDDFLEGPGA